MLWPVCLLVPTQFPYYAHQHLVSSFHLSIGLIKVRQSPSLLYVYKLTKLSDNVAFKVGSSVTQYLGWGSKDWDVTLVQKLSNSFCSLIGGHICHYKFCKVVIKDKNVHHIWGLILISMLVKSMCNNSKEVVTMMGLYWGFGTSAFMLDALLAAANCLLYLSSHSWPPEQVMQ